ncbi:MAG: bacteriophage receptor, outer rane subunit [Bacteroidetes bacterium]|nr:bacteriophage receptor, outer rane subunit [Bacteroidota bacterium]
MEFLNTIKRPYILLFLFALSVGVYFNTIKNEYAFDDEIIVSGNKPVQKGFAGIKEIFSTDMFASYLEDAQVTGNKLSGGRYRPLSVASFAIEQQFVGFSPGPKHFVNMALYGLLVMLIFLFIFRDLKLSLTTAFAAAFLFALHPIHTEVVANIKSRDEILSLIFYILTISSYLKYLDVPTRKNLISTSLCFIAALLSKEYAITLLAVLPVAAYTLRDYTLKNALKSIWVLMAIFAAYALIRGKIVGWGAPEQMDPLNNAYVFATGAEKLATKLYILLKYFILLLKPFPLSADYSYAQIAYRTFASWDVWASILLHCTLLYFTVRLIVQRNIYGLIGIIYFSNLFLVSNLVFNIGASMGERFLFHSSFAFCLALGLGLQQLKEKLSPRSFASIANTFLVIVLIGSVMIVVPRNRDWKNSHTLFLKDVETSPNSALCNANAAVAMVNMAFEPAHSSEKTGLLKKAVAYSEHAIRIHPKFGNAYFNEAVCYYHMGNYDSAFVLWDKGFSIFDSKPHKATFAALAYKRGLSEGQQKQFGNAVKLLEWACKTDPGNASYWSDLGGAYYSTNRLEEAKACWEKTLSIDPSNEQANKALPFIKMKLAEIKK